MRDRLEVGCRERAGNGVDPHFRGVGERAQGAVILKIAKNETFDPMRPVTQFEWVMERQMRLCSRAACRTSRAMVRAQITIVAGDDRRDGTVAERDGVSSAHAPPPYPLEVSEREYQPRFRRRRKASNVVCAAGDHVKRGPYAMGESAIAWSAVTGQL